MATEVALDPTQFKPFRLLERRQVSSDTYAFRFALNHPDQLLGLPTGQYIIIRALCDVGEGKKEMVEHCYSPITANDVRGYVEFLIKLDPRGRLTQHLFHMNINDTIEMRGPEGKFEYVKEGDCVIADSSSVKRALHVEALAMIAGGCGITPLLQIIRAIRKNPADSTRIYLLYANQTPNDIAFREELDELEKESKGRVKVWYTVDRNAPEGWSYDVGFITEKMLRAHLPSLDESSDKKETEGEEAKPRSVLALICGPPVMTERAVKPNLAKMGYTEEDLFVF